MLLDVVLPQLGESVTEGTVVKWRVAAGERVDKDQVLVEIATDKADSELPSPAAGVVVELLAAEGQTLPVRALLCRIEEGAQASSAPTKAADAPPPDAGKSDAAAAGVSVTGAVLATPSARKSALEHELDLGKVPGSGPGGRVTRDDVLRVVPDAPKVVPVAPPTPPKAAAQALAGLVNEAGGFVPPIPGKGFGAFKVPPYRPKPGDKVIPYTRRRRITADHMVYSKFASPHVVTVAEVDLHRASQLREKHKERYKADGLSLTMLAFAVAATARALREHPDLNARVLDDSFVLLRDVNIGVAVDSPEGLVVPVVRHADELGVRGVVRAIDDLARRAKGGKITIDDLSGATFSVTNPGIKGNLFGGAVINQPNVGILRMGEIQKRVVVVEGPSGEDAMVIHPVMFMALSYDHRVVDGVAANSFLYRVTELLEGAAFEL